MVSVDGTMQYLNDLGLNMESCEMLLPMEVRVSSFAYYQF